MTPQPASTHVSVGTRGFDLIGFDLPDEQRPDDDRPAASLAASQRQPAADGLHLYSSEMGARLFERMMEEFEDELFGAAR